MKKFWEIVKNAFKDKRKRAVISLGFWIIFFIAVFVMVGGPVNIDYEYQKRTSSSNSNISKPVTKNTLENFKKVDNTEFTYDVTITEYNKTLNYKIEGTYYDKDYYFTLDGVSYYLKDDIIYLVDDVNHNLVTFRPDANHLFNRMDGKLMQMLRISELYTTLTSSEEQTKTTYKDNTTVTSFAYKVYDGRSIAIKMTEKDNKLGVLSLDYTNYAVPKTQLFRVDITYNNMDNIADYNKDYHTYTYDAVITPDTTNNPSSDLGNVTSNPNSMTNSNLTPIKEGV